MKTKILVFFAATIMISATSPVEEYTYEQDCLELIKGLDTMTKESVYKKKFNEELFDRTNELQKKLIEELGYENFKKELEISLAIYYSNISPGYCINAEPCIRKAYNEYTVPSCFGDSYLCKRLKWNKYVKEVENCYKLYCHNPNGDSDGDGERDGPLPFED